MTNSKSSNGYKKVRYSRRPQRRQKAQKQKNEQQKHLNSQSVLDRNDRAIGFSKWQQQRITLSQLILPKPSNSTQKDGNEVKTIQQKKKTPKIDNKQIILEPKNAEKKQQKNLEKNSNEETQQKMKGNDEKENGEKLLQNVAIATIANKDEKQLENGKMEEMPKPKGKDNSKENKKKKGGKRSEKTVKPNENALEQNGQPLQNQKVKEIEEKKKQQNNSSSLAENPLLILMPLINGSSKVEESKIMETKSDIKNQENEAQNETTMNGVAPLTIDTFSEGINRENDGMDEAILTECSTDSGIEILNNGTNGNDSPQANSQSPQKSSDTMKSTDGAVDKKEEPKGPVENGDEPKVSRFEKRVYEFVDEVTEKMEMKTALLVTNESVAPMLQPLKVEPLNLERIRFSEKKRNKKPRQYKLLDSDIEYCKYMAEKYGQEYEAMTQDGKNVFGDSAKSLERKLRIYKDFLKQQSNGGV